MNAYKKNSAGKLPPSSQNKMSKKMGAVQIPNPCDNKKKLSHGQFATLLALTGSLFWGATNGFAQL